MDRLIERLKADGADGFVTVTEVVQAFRCSRSYVYKLIDAGALRGVGRIGTDYRIPLEEARRFAREAGFLQD
jgi:excisionase family DNA binding protein